MIQKVSTFQASIPFEKSSSPLPSWVDQYSNNLFVVAENGSACGYGQILTAALNAPEPYVSLVERMKSFIHEREESAVEEINLRMRKLFFNAGYGITTGAIGGIDIALWDLYAKTSKAPLYKLIGGKHNKIRRYISLPRYSSVESLTQAISVFYDEGYRRIKLHQNAEETIEATAILNREFPDLSLSLDLSCTLSPNSARRFVESIKKYEVDWVEEPVFPPNDYKTLMELNKQVPIAAGENIFSTLEFKYCMENEIFTYYQPDVSKFGGISVAKEFLEIAAEHGVPVAFHNRPNNGWVQILASAHAASAYDGEIMVESPYTMIPGKYYNIDSFADIENINLRGIGLGISPKENLPGVDGTVPLVP